MKGHEADGGLDLASEFELKTKESSAEKSKFGLHIKTFSATMGGQPFPMEPNKDFDIERDKYGVPTSMDMHGIEVIYSIAFAAAHMPNKALKVGESYRYEIALEGAKFAVDGKYEGDEEVEGVKYAVVSSKSEFFPDGQESGQMVTKTYFDRAKGQVVKMVSDIDTPDGSIKMQLKLVPAKS